MTQPEEEKTLPSVNFAYDVGDLEFIYLSFQPLGLTRVTHSFSFNEFPARFHLEGLSKNDLSPERESNILVDQKKFDSLGNFTG